MKKTLAILLSVVMLVSVFSVSVFASGEARTVVDGDTLTETVDYGENAAVEIKAVPVSDGSITLTVDGTERDLVPGTYSGHVVLTVTEKNPVEYAKGNMTHEFRQAAYIDGTGLAEDKSVLAAVQGGTVSNDAADGITVVSQGEAFNGVYVAGGEYVIRNSEFDFTGDGGNDFAGFGSAVMATGEGTRLTLEDSHIHTEGVVRTTLTPANGANVIVKNSVLEANDGVLPEDYVPNTSLGYMKSVPWMLGLSGNNRATNMLGANTQETFIGSTVSTGGWGILSVDDCNSVKLTGINSTFFTTGIAGYGCYGIGNAVDRFYGCDFDVATYAAIMTGGGSVYFGDSTPENVASLNEELDLQLTDEEMTAIESKGSHLKTGGSAIMIFDSSGGSAEMGGSTVVEAGRAVFLTRSGVASITVDGSEGAELHSDIGVILQMIDLDKAQRQNVEIDGVTYSVYPGPWTEPYASYEEIELSASAEPTEATSRDVVASFSNIELEGGFYNGTTGAGTVQNLQLTLDNATVNGVISASFARHEKSELYPEDWQCIGVVENTVYPAVNNGVILTLENGAVWNVTGESYITSLTLDETSTVNGIVTVDGMEIELAPGTYTGTIAVVPAGGEPMSAAPASGSSSEPPAKPDGTAMTGSSTGDVQSQSFSLYPMDGYPKTFEGYIDWVCAALESQTGNPNLARELETVRAITEDTYNPEAMPFSMQIRFGLICSYADYIG